MFSMIDYLQFFSIKTELVTPSTENISTFILKSLDQRSFELQDYDVIILASKMVSTIEGNRIPFADIKEVRIEAEHDAMISGLDPRFVEVVYREADQVFGAVKGAVLALKNGILQANAGVDNSNSGGKDYLITLPKNPLKTAIDIQNEISNRTGKKIAVIISDSKTNPLRRGTSGFALAVAGIIPVIDDKGTTDLFGYKMSVTSRALADNLVCGAEILMGETNQCVPIVIARGLDKGMFVEGTNVIDLNNSMKMDKEKCIYIGPLLKLIKK